MLMDILMESLMSMDEDTLDYVLESCSDEEIELIDGAMEQMNINKLERKHAKAEGEAIAKYYKTTSLKYGTGLNTKESKDIDIGREITNKMVRPDGKFAVSAKDMSKANKLWAQMKKRGGNGNVGNNHPYTSARGYALDRAVGRRAAYDAGVKALDNPAPVYNSKKEELIDRLKNTKRYQNKNS